MGALAIHGLVVYDYYGEDGSYICNHPMEDLLGDKPVPSKGEVFDPAPACYEHAKLRLAGAIAVFPLTLSMGVASLRSGKTKGQIWGIVRAASLTGLLLLLFWGWTTRENLQPINVPSLQEGDVSTPTP